MLAALSVGSYVLAFFGITLAALRIAGGVVVALTGWNLLNAPEDREACNQQQAGSPAPSDDIALFPMTIPITAGPGTISVAAALGAEHPRAWPDIGWFFLGMTGTAMAMALLIWALYSFAERLTALMGPTGKPHRHAAGGLPAAVHRGADPDHRRAGRAGADAGGAPGGLIRRGDSRLLANVLACC